MQHSLTRFTTAEIRTEIARRLAAVEANPNAVLTVVLALASAVTEMDDPMTDDPADAATVNVAMLVRLAEVRETLRTADQDAFDTACAAIVPEAEPLPVVTWPVYPDEIRSQLMAPASRAMASAVLPLISPDSSD